MSLHYQEIPKERFDELEGDTKRIAEALGANSVVSFPNSIEAAVYGLKRLVQNNPAEQTQTHGEEL